MRQFSKFFLGIFAVQIARLFFDDDDFARETTFSPLSYLFERAKCRGQSTVSWRVAKMRIRGRTVRQNLRPRRRRFARTRGCDAAEIREVSRGLASAREKGEIGCRSRGDRGDSS